LGLSIAKQLVELQGGTIHVGSPGEDRGTTFTVRLPFYTAQSAASDHRLVSTTLPEHFRADFEPVDLSGVKVLVVDDEIDALSLIEQVLGDVGAKTLMATNAGDALLLIQSERPDIIVSDIGMPDVDGFELIRRVRKLEEPDWRNLPAIALTAFTRHEDKKKALLSGFTSFMVKPVNPSLLVSTIASLVSERSDTSKII
jgi:CheY-like chemotaxis protein